jgi:hypothetical protein
MVPMLESDLASLIAPCARFHHCCCSAAPQRAAICLQASHVGLQAAGCLHRPPAGNWLLVHPCGRRAGSLSNSYPSNHTPPPPALPPMQEQHTHAAALMRSAETHEQQTPVAAVQLGGAQHQHGAGHPWWDDGALLKPGNLVRATTRMPSPLSLLAGNCWFPWLPLSFSPPLHSHTH